MSVRSRSKAILRRLDALSVNSGDWCPDCGRRLLPAPGTPELPLFLRDWITAKADQQRTGHGFAEFAVGYCQCRAEDCELWKPDRTEASSGTKTDP